MQQHFVTFYSPGTFMAEESCKPVPSWDVAAAVAMSREIVERYGAEPYGFRFSTRTRADDELDSKLSAESCMYFLHGKIETLAEVEAREPDSILASNMRSNGYGRVITTTKGWRWTQPFRDGDVLLNDDGTMPAEQPPATNTADSGHAPKDAGASS